MQDLIPGKLASVDTPPLTVQKPKRNVYRPTNQCPYLEYCLIEWLQREHLADPDCAVRPPDLILSEMQCASLIRTDPKAIKMLKDITALLQESDNWDEEWSMKIFEVIKEFKVNYTRVKATGQTAKQKK